MLRPSNTRDEAQIELAPAAFLTESQQYTNANRAVTTWGGAGPIDGLRGPLNARTDTGRTSSDLMTGGTVTQPREVQAGPFVGSGPLQAELRTRMNPDASRTVSAGDAWPLRVLVSILWQPGRGAVAHRIWVDEIFCSSLMLWSDRFEYVHCNKRCMNPVTIF